MHPTAMDVVITGLALGSAAGILSGLCAFAGARLAGLAANATLQRGFAILLIAVAVRLMLVAR